MGRNVIVGRPINDISLNGLEYLLNDDGSYMVFEDMDAAKKFLIENGFGEEEMDDLVFKESVGNCFRCGSPLFQSDIEGYTTQCLTCDEDFFSFEQVSNI